MAFDIAHHAEPQAAIAGATGRVTLRVSTDEAEWRDLIAAAPVPHLPQDYSFAAGKQASGWPSQRIVLSRDGLPVAFAVVLQLRKLGIRLFNRINRGPVLLDPAPGEDDVLEIYRALRHGVGRFWNGPLLIAPALPRTDANVALLRRAGFIRRAELSWRSGRIDIAVPEAELWGRFTSTFRNRARTAGRAGATLQIRDDAAAYEWMIERHIENMATKGFSAAKPELLRGLRAAAPENVLVFQLRHEGAPVAGMSVVRFGHVAEYHVGWFGPEGRKLNAGNFLMWNVMCEMRRRGVRTFDVGGLREGDGYTRFKRTMRPTEYDLAGEWISF